MSKYKELLKELKSKEDNSFVTLAREKSRNFWNDITWEYKTCSFSKAFNLVGKKGWILKDYREVEVTGINIALHAVNVLSELLIKLDSKDEK